MLKTIRYFIYTLTFAILTCSNLNANDTDTNDISRYQNIITLTTAQLYNLGDSSFQKQDLDSALFYFSILSNRYNLDMNNEEIQLCALGLEKTGNIHYFKNNYSKAMESFLMSLHICEENNFEDIMVDVYKNIGNIYASYADYETAIKYFTIALDLAHKKNDMQAQNRLLYNLTGACCFNNDLDSAINYFNEMKSHKEDNPLYDYSVLITQAMINSYNNKIPLAIDNYRESAIYAQKYHLGVRYLGAAISGIASSYTGINMLDSALYYHHKNETIANESKQMDLLVETLKSLAEVYKLKGNITKSLHYKSQYLDLSDSIFNQSKFYGLKNAQFLYEIDKYNTTINKLNLKNKKSESVILSQKRILIIITITSLLFIALLLIVYYQKRNLDTAYNDLFDRNQDALINEKFYKKRLTDLESKLEQEQINKINPIKEDNASSAGVTLLTPLQQEKIIADIQRIMDNTLEFCDSDFTIDKLATLIDSNTKYVSQAINEVYNKNFRTFLNGYRIKEAMQRLADIENYGNYTIKSISESVGYKSQANFITVFTKHTGIKPSMYQKLSLSRK